jgi:hypothetical protein
VSALARGALPAAVLLAAGGAGAQAAQQVQAPVQQQARLQASAEQLASPAGATRIRVCGGAPHEALLLCAQGPAGRVLHPLLLDARGRWERVLVDVELDAEVELVFLRRAGAGAPWLGARTRVRGRKASAGKGPQQGAIVITELMKDPVTVSDSQGEWVEIVNTSPMVVDIEGWTLSDTGSNNHTISNNGLGVRLAPGRRFVLGIQDDPTLNGGVLVDYRYSGFSLSNGADEVILRDAKGILVDMVAYDDGVLWPDAPGVALNLHPAKQSASLNDDPTSWCEASTPIGAGNPDLGTPGTINTICP